MLLSFIAAATQRLRLQTGILVLPYRNPFPTANAAVANTSRTAQITSEADLAESIA